MTEWRPDDWVGQPDYCYKCLGHQDGKCVDCLKHFEAGASAMLSTVLKWLDGKCDKHPLDDGDYINRRLLCPQCMAELRGQE